MIYHSYNNLSVSISFFWPFFFSISDDLNNMQQLVLLCCKLGGLEQHRFRCCLSEHICIKRDQCVYIIICFIHSKSMAVKITYLKSVSVQAWACTEIQLTQLYDQRTTLEMEALCLSSSFPHPRVPITTPLSKSPLKARIKYS